MGYVIYNKETTEILQVRARSVGCYTSSYKTESAAKAALTRLDKKGLLGKQLTSIIGGGELMLELFKSDFAIAEAGDFKANIEKTVTRRNAMTGAEFQESVNANYSTSPASENYWCS